MTPTATVKMTLVLPQHHRWLTGLRGSSLVIEYLLDQEFGTKAGVGDQADIIAAEKIVKAQKIIKQMRSQKQNRGKNVPNAPNKHERA